MCLQMKHKEEVDHLLEEIYCLKVDICIALSLSLTSVSHHHPTLTLCFAVLPQKMFAGRVGYFSFKE